MSNQISGDEILQKIQAKLAEQNEVIREQMIQIEEQQTKIAELESKLESVSSADAERNAMLSKLAELVE